MNFVQNKNLDIKRIQEAIVLFAVVCITISYFGGYYLIITTIGHHSRLLRQITVALLFLKIVTTRYTKKEFGWVALLLALAMANYQYSGSTRAIYNALMICSLKDVDLTKVFKVSFFSIVFIIGLLGTLALLGVTGTVSVIENFGRGDAISEIETRYYMGYIHPNTWAHAMFIAMLLGVVAFWEKFDWKGILILCAVNYVVYRLAVSRTSFLCGAVLIILIAITKYAKRIFDFRIIRWAAIAGVTAIWSIVFTAKIDPVNNIKWQIIDWKLFTGRLLQAKVYLEECGLSLFGVHVPDELSNGYILDMGYMRMLLENGVLIFLLMFTGTIAVMFCAFKKKKYDMIVVAACICLYGVYENLAISQVPANLVLYFISYIIFGKGVLKNEQQIDD